MVSAFAACVFLATYIFNNDEVAESEESKSKRNSTLSPNWCCNSSIFDPLQTAAIRGYPEEVEKILLKDSNNIDNHTEGGLTPLHWACIRGNVEVVKKLLTFKANVFSTDDDNNTALHMAALGGNLEVVRILLVYDSPINFQNIFGDTPLHLAVKEGHFDIAETLLSHGASINILNFRRKTPLGLAVTKRNEPLVRLLRTASEHSEAHYWVEVNGKIPPNAVIGGNDPHNCNRSYVGRVLIEGHYVPAKVCPDLNLAFAVFKSLEFSSAEFEVLTSNHGAWRRMTDEDDIPYEAILGGITPTGEKIYIGRSYVSFDGVLYLVPGKDFGINVLDWPALVRDLNRIENLWGAMVREVYDLQKPEIKNIDELQERITQAGETWVRSSNRRLYVPLIRQVYEKRKYEILVSF